MNETSFTLDLGDPMRAGVFFVTSDAIAILGDIVHDGPDITLVAAAAPLGVTLTLPPPRACRPFGQAVTISVVLDRSNPSDDFDAQAWTELREFVR